MLPPEPGQTGGVEPTAGIEVTAAVPPVGFALNIVQPQLQLDDLDPVPWRWGSGLLAVVPGPHRLRCWFRWGAFREAGNATVEVEVPDGAMVRLRYTAPSGLVFKKGKWTSEPTVACLPSAAGWHPDPSGRHSLRYWDGSGWTPHVSTGGVTSTDAPA